MIPITFPVLGEPKGQPRARRSKWGGVYNPKTADAWKQAVAWTAKANIHTPLTGAVDVVIMFYFKRPPSHFGTGKNRAFLKGCAPLAHVKKPDIDNAIKATLDALTGIAWLDDVQVCCLSAKKEWTAGSPSATIRIMEIT